MHWISILAFLLPLTTAVSAAPAAFEVDSIRTTAGTLTITFIGHGTLMLQLDDFVIQVDPVAQYADYATLPKADLILITHEHGDHLSPEAVQALKKENTLILYSARCAEKVANGIIMRNGETKTVKKVTIQAVPAYNLVHLRNDGSPYHPRGVGNGYVLTFGDKKVYIAGDTENIPEMKTLQNIDIAFLPMNLPYTMTPEMAAEAAQWIQPKILYPYHYGNTDVRQLQQLLADSKNIEIRIRKLN
jgi:L-ascorbate metabolism protein UlaG (beta-lactamase superfamily)